MSNNPRNQKEEAIRLLDMHSNISFGLSFNENHIHPLVKTQARATVIAIVKALHITTGHLTLSQSDQIEVSRDIQYWQDVRKEIEKL